MGRGERMRPRFAALRGLSIERKSELEGEDGWCDDCRPGNELRPHCGARSKARIRFQCTRDQGHEGKHAACAGPFTSAHCLTRWN
jgi:hypothetical protein